MALFSRRTSTAIVVASLFVSADASAFCRTTTCQTNCTLDENGCPQGGVPLYWNRPCVGFSMQQNGTQMIDLASARLAVANSFASWTGIDCGGGMTATMTFSELADVSCDKAEYNPKGQNANIVIFRDNDWSYQGIDGTLAKTSVTFDVNTGEIFDADIEINSAYNIITVSDTDVQYDLQSIVTHEAGHFIGMAHSPDLDATMYASYEPGTTSIRTLSADDKAGACAIYPPGRQAGTCDPTPNGGFGVACPDSTSHGCAVAPDDERRASSSSFVVLAGLCVVIAASWSRRRFFRGPS